MDGERPNHELQRLIHAITTSEVVECRIELINQLGEINLSDKSELASLAKWLAVSKLFSLIAAKYLVKDISGCLERFVILGTKASEWCTQHFSMPLTSTEGSQEEHSAVFFELLLALLGFSAAVFSVLIKSPAVGQKEFTVTVEEFVLKQLNLAKVAISEIKMIHSVASEVLKVAQEVLNASVRLCRAYHHTLSELCDMKTANDGGSMDIEKADKVNHVITITTCTIDCLYELGIIAAAGGGTLVAILNVSWKGLVTLLQLITRDVAAKVNVKKILSSLISLATDSLRCAAKLWSSTPKEDIALAEAKRTFLPVKFYLINAVRILSQYPREAFTIYKELTSCCLMIATFGISLSRATPLKASSETLTELLEPTSNLLLHTLFNSVDVEEESKLQILDWLFIDDDLSGPINPEELNTNPSTCMDEIFSVTCEAMPKTRLLVLGRVVLYLNLLRSSPDLGEEARLGIARKLGWLFKSLIEEDVFSFILDLHIPMLYGSGPALQLVWQPMFIFVLHALKIFMVVASLGSAWEEVETILLENFLNPHFLLREVVMELWSFILRHAEIEMVNNIIGKLCLILNSMVSSEQVLMPGSALRKMARSICNLLSYAPPSILDQVYSSFLTDDRSSLSSMVNVILLIEGFPLNLLSDKLKKLATQRIITGYYSFMESNGKKLRVDNFSRSCSMTVLGGPVYALSSALRCLKISSSEINTKTLKFILSLIHGYRSATESLKDTYCKLLNQLLSIISNMEHLYATVEMEEVIFELQTLFSITSFATDARLYQCKPDLALFMAGLGEMTVGEGSPVITALCEMYHTLLRERHWVLVHMAISAFGKFASRTTCNELWRFIPHDAALSFDIDTGSELNEDRFMVDLKAFLEKESAIHVVAPCTEQLALLASEALTLKQLVNKSQTTIPEDSISDDMEIDDEIQVNKKRKLPDEICEGMALLQSGLKIMGDGLSQWQQQNKDTMDFQKFSTDLSRLEDVIAHLASFAESR
ncbi:Holliday junction resolvase [Thalictrum thalictroides]|uniref:Holliday junction resolvase n=1 Tax=Thalictrum thalictroides TaxID=46969 RepID=A0A7J6W4S3_THATH|nr:Holliday junction resolvase [Thalictrum thalictroides]